MSDGEKYDSSLDRYLPESYEERRNMFLNENTQRIIVHDRLTDGYIDASDDILTQKKMIMIRSNLLNDALKTMKQSMMKRKSVRSKKKCNRKSQMSCM